MKVIRILENQLRDYKCYLILAKELFLQNPTEELQREIIQTTDEIEMAEELLEDLR